VDKQGGTVRVPIDRAIDMLAAKGLPSHNYLDDILAGRKPATAAKPGARRQKPIAKCSKEVAMRSKIFDRRLNDSGGVPAGRVGPADGHSRGYRAHDGARRRHRSKPERADSAGADRSKTKPGQVVRLGQYFRDKPVVLALVYYECPGLCDLILNGLSHAMEQISLNVGSDYEVVTVSFNPKETWQLATAKKANYIEKYKARRAPRPEGWHFLTGDEDVHQEPGRHRRIPL
jgi:hypothetical protein